MKVRGTAGLVGAALVVLVSVLLVVSTNGGSVTEPESVVTSTILDYPTSTRTFVPSQTIEPTSLPTETPNPTETSTATPLPTATTPVLVTPLAGYTFYGTQLEFLKTNFGWSYELTPCAAGFQGVGNVKINDPNNCVIRVYPTKKDRSTGVYLFRANNYVFPEGSSVAAPYNLRLYLYQGGGLDNSVNWGSLSGTELWEALAGFYEVAQSEFFFCDPVKRPTIQRIIPLSADEFDVVAKNPQLFPLWVDYCRFE